MTEIIKDTLEEYLKEFYGYGNLDSDFWFIGKEEAGGESQKDIEARLNAWKESNKSEVADLYEFHDRIFSYKSPATSNTDLFRLFDHTSRKFKLQKTWAGLIKLQLASEEAYDGKNCSIIKKYQSESLGRFDETVQKSVSKLSKNKLNFNFDTYGTKKEKTSTFRRLNT